MAFGTEDSAEYATEVVEADGLDDGEDAEGVEEDEVAVEWQEGDEPRAAVRLLSGCGATGSDLESLGHKSIPVPPTHFILGGHPPFLETTCQLCTSDQRFR
jgi:hypothetical protein